MLGKRRVPPPLEYLQQRLLNQAVDDAWHAEPSDAAGRFRDIDPFDRLRRVGSVEQLFPDGWPVLPQVGRGVVDGQSVDAGTTLVPTDAFPRFFQVASVAHLLHELVFGGRAVGGSLRREWFGPWAVGGRGFTPPGRRQGQTQRVLDCLPRSTHESRVLLATPNRSGLRRVAAAVRSLAVSALSGQCLDRAGRRVPSTVPSADFCIPFRSSHDSLSPVHGTERRSPGVSLTAVTAVLPDLQPWPLMDVDFAISRPLVRPRMPRIRFLFVRSRLCFTLPPDPASRRRPCASLALRLHQAVQRTCTSKLSNMPGARLNRSAVDAGSTCRL